MIDDARTLLRRHGFAAKKHWGQNFLVSERVFSAIVNATVAADDDWVVEIGAGLGTLTARLAARVPDGRVVAIEREPDMLTVLERELGDCANVDIVARDALSFDYGEVARARGSAVVVCGNLPYQIASPLLFRVLEFRRDVSRAVVMVQREMAERIVASPSTKAYGSLTVMIATYADVAMVVRAPPGAFVPPPRVDSAVISVTPLPGGRARVPIADDAHYATVVRAAFGQRRKTLRNALRARFDDAAVDAALDRSTIEPRRRGETLTIAEFATLAAHLPADARAT